MPAYYSDYYNHRSCVYRLFDKDFELLYVGLALNPEQRYLKHRRKPWWKYVEYKHVDCHPDRESAKAAERWAIYTEEPFFNKARPTFATEPTVSPIWVGVN